MSKNWGASFRSRLLNLSKARGQVYGEVLVRYALEGFLVRLSGSRYGHRFILKGAMLFALWQPQETYRPTQDLDLLCFGPPDIDLLVTVFQEICQIEPGEPDGLLLDSSSVRARPIREEDLYGGVRVNLTARLDTARIPLQIDIGFGDRVVPEAVVWAYPGLLRTPFAMRAYAQETTIAEKCHAMVERGALNSRMKDFFDLHYLSQRFAFQGQHLVTALRSTFQRRGRALPDLPLLAFTPEFFENPATLSRWKAFIEKTRLPNLAFTTVVAAIESFVSPPLARAVRDDDWFAHWAPGGPWRLQGQPGGLELFSR